MFEDYILATLLLGGAALYVLWGLLAPSKTPSLRLPPGPKPLPVVGNINDLPPAGAKEWEHWLKHKDLYGPISSVTVFGTTLVLLNDAKVAFDLLEKKSSIHSSRPDAVFSMQMCGFGHLLASLPYSEQLRVYRKHFHGFIGAKTTLSRFYPLQDVEVHRFLLRTLESPADVLKHTRKEAGAIILKMAYGYTVEPHGTDPLVDIADTVIAQFSVAAVPGRWLVDTVPILRYLPDWFPGAGFKKTARELSATLMELVEEPVLFVRAQMADKKNQPSFISGLFDRADGHMSEEEEYVAKWSAASMYTGGADTSVSTMQTFFLAMMLHPNVQKKAHEEIERVVGSHRLPTLPTMDDRETLPYVEAIVAECFRWHPIAPMGLPHVSSEEDTYNGFSIPKGAMVIPNIWWFAHDPKHYPEPMSFNPNRWLLSPPPQHPRNYVFGFGRRICPGRLLAESSVWLTVAKSLAAFDIAKPMEDGKTIEPVVDFDAGIISHPAPFKASITARNRQYEDLIRAVEQDHPWEKSNAEEILKMRK